MSTRISVDVMLNLFQHLKSMHDETLKQVQGDKNILFFSDFNIFQ